MSREELDLVDLISGEDFGYDEEDPYELKEEIIRLRNKIIYAKSILEEYVDEEVLIEAFGD
jgi:hypothetical protein